MRTPWSAGATIYCRTLEWMVPACPAKERQDSAPRLAPWRLSGTPALTSDDIQPASADALVRKPSLDDHERYLNNTAPELNRRVSTVVRSMCRPSMRKMGVPDPTIVGIT
jgi:hypothetical protein